MPLPGGLWWLLCCRRGFTLLHRDYGDGEFSGDGDEDEDEETFELRTPGSMGGGRVSTGEPGLRLCAPRGAPDPAATLAKRSDELNAARGRRAPHSRGARGPCRIPGAVHLLRARGSGVSRVARPGPASAFPAGPASHPVSFRLRQRQGMWRGRPGGSIAWVLCTPLWRMRSQILELPPCGHGRGPGRYGLQKRGSASLRGPHGGGAGGYDALSLGTELSAFTGESSLEVTLTQPGRSGQVSDRLQSWEETRSLISEKGLQEDNPDLVVQGWLYREPRRAGTRPWLPPRRAWFVLTRDSLDQFSGSGKGARHLSSLVLTSLCSVTGPERRPKETGLWSLTVSGRKHSLRLCSPRQAEAERWGVALREVIASKVPLETPTQLLLRDIEESCGDPEAVALIYRRNPILRHTSGALYAPLLPLPYGGGTPGPGYAPLREEAVRLFLALQALEGARRPGPLMQGVLQTCRDLPALRDELFLQLAKQTSGPAGPPGLPAAQDPAALRYWQLLTCMSCTFRPGGAVRGHLLGHLERTERALPDSELAEYARFIRKALGRTRGRELVPSLAEIAALSRRQELLCTVHCPGARACPVAIDSYTTAGEVAQELVGRLGLARSRNAFALYEQRGAQERALAGGTIVADVLTSLAAETAGPLESPDADWRLCLRLHGPLHPEGLSPEGPQMPFLFEQAHALLLRARPAPPDDDALRALAALRLQNAPRDLGPRAPSPSRPSTLSSALLAGTARRAERGARRSVGAGVRAGGEGRGEGGARPAATVLGGWKRLRGLGRAEAMAAYLALAAQYPGLGAARYDVLELSTEPGGGAPQKLCLGLGATALSLSRPGDTEPIHRVSYGCVAACQLMGPHTLVLRVGDSQMLLQSPQVEEIMQLVNVCLATPALERPPCQEQPDTAPPGPARGLDQSQGQSGCLGQLQD